MITLATLLFIAFAYLEGIREAYYFHFRWLSPLNRAKDLHSMFTAERALMFISTMFVPFPLYSWWGLLAGVPMALVFIYIHDGAYYMKRNDGDPSVYPLRWKDQTTSSTAWIDMPYIPRLILFVIGMVISVTGDGCLIFYIRTFDNFL